MALINILKKVEKPARERLICLKNQHMQVEQIKFFVRTMIYRNAEFVAHPYAKQDGKVGLANTSICFKDPEENYKLGFLSDRVKNFFFEFSKFEEKDERENLLGRQLVLIDPVLRYSSTLAHTDKETKHDNWLSRLLAFLSNIKRLFRSPPPTASSTLYLNHIPFYSSYAASQEVFLSKYAFNRTFVVPPHKELVIPRALTVIPLNRSGLNVPAYPVYILLKNNFTQLHVS